MPTLFVDPGALRTELSLQAPGSAATAWAGWCPAGPRWRPCSARSSRGRRQAVSAPARRWRRLTHRITMRHRAGVASGMRLVAAGADLRDPDVHDPDETGRYLVCRVREEGA